MVKTIKVRFNEKKSKDGNSFFTCKAQKIDGSWVSIKFVRDVNIPDKVGVYTMTVESTDMNKSANDYGEVWWVKNKADFVEYQQPDVACDEF